MTQNTGNQQSRRPLIFAHRGASADAPENTLAAVALAWRQGADGIETDVHLTRDGQIICIHDPTTRRTGNRELRVAESTLEDLRQIDAGSWKDARFAGERLPTLAQVLANLPDGKVVMIEIKCGPEAVPVIGDLLRSRPCRGRILLASFNQDVVLAAGRELPELCSGWIVASPRDRVAGRRVPVVADVLGEAVRIGAQYVSVQGEADYVNAAFITECHQRNVPVHTWTIDDEHAAVRLAAIGVDSIITNRPEAIRRVMPT